MTAAGPAVPAGPLESAPGGFVPQPARAAILAGVLAGMELGEWDRQMSDWLCGLDTPTLLTVASWVARARAQRPAR